MKQYDTEFFEMIAVLVRVPLNGIQPYMSVYEVRLKPVASGVCTWSHGSEHQRGYAWIREGGGGGGIVWYLILYTATQNLCFSQRTAIDADTVDQKWREMEIERWGVLML